MSDRNLQFSVDSLLLGEIGERLVTKNHIALAELVKNAYDADASSITIRFINAAQDRIREESEITIADNGNGMNFSQIKEYWMRIATPNKLRDPITSRFGRRKAGSKGIGRFACARLARKLMLESIGKRDDGNKLDRTVLVFNWDEYKPGTTLTAVNNSCSTEILTQGSTGTTLRLVGLRDPWKESDFNVLRRQILGLSIATTERRKGFEEDPGFSILLDAPGFEKGIGTLSEQVMNAGWGRLRGSVSKNGTATLDLEAMQIGKTRFEFTEKFEKIPGTNFDITVIWNRKEYCRDSQTLALYTINNIFENWSGIKVFLDGFRVYPYGDVGDDWLGIDQRQARRLGKIDPIFERISSSLLGVDESRALLNQPRNQNLVGKVFVTNKYGPTYEVLINREGFVESSATEQLKELLLKALDWTTIYYNHFLYVYRDEKLVQKTEELEKIEKSLESAEEREEIPKIVDSAITVIDEVYKDYTDKVPADQRKSIAKYAKTAMDVVEVTVRHMNRQITALRAMASAGALLLVLSHETRDVVNKLGTLANSLKVLSETSGVSKKKELIQLSNAMRETRNRLIDQMALFGEVSASVSHMEKQRINLFRLAQEIALSFRGLNEEYSINLEIVIPQSLWTGPMLKGEAYSILINLLSNAEKATIAGHGTKIRIEAFGAESEIVLRLCDDGIGLSAESGELILKTGVPDPENRLYKALSKRLGADASIAVGKGSGLGLTIVREILSSYDKHLKFVDAELPWKTCVEVTLPS